MATNFGDRVNELRKYGEKVTIGLFPEVKGKPIKTKSIIVNGVEVGNPGTLHFMVTEDVEGREYSFNARLYTRLPKLYKGRLPPNLKDHESYLFLRNAGIEEVPKSFVVEEAQNWLFTEHIQGRTLRDVFSEKSDYEELKKVSHFLATFQNKAKKYADSFPEEKGNKIFWSRNIEDQAKNYLNVYMNKEEDKVGIASEIYIKLFGEALRGVFLCHGDLSPSNLIKQDKTGQYYIIDPELKRRNGFADLGSLISYLGDYEDYWDGLAESFKISQLKFIVESENGMPRTGVISRVLGKDPYKLKDEGKQNAHFEMHGNIIHYSLRIIAKRKTYDEEDYEAQEKNVFTVLDSFSRKPKRFGLTDKLALEAKKLEELLIPYSLSHKDRKNQQ